MINDSDAAIVVVSNALQWKKIEAIREELPGVRHFMTIARSRRPRVLTFADVMAQGRGPERTIPASSRAGPSRPARGHRLDHLHLGHDRRCQGRHADPRQPGHQHHDRVASIIAFSDKDTVPLLPAAVPHPGADGRPSPTSTKAAPSPTPRASTRWPRTCSRSSPTSWSAPRASSRRSTPRSSTPCSPAPGCKRKIFFWALKTGKAASRRKLSGSPAGGSWASSADRPQARLPKILAKTGGRVRFFVSGGAPLSRDIAEFFHAIGLMILEGYGLTETAPVIAVNTFEKLQVRQRRAGPCPASRSRSPPTARSWSRGPTS